MRIQEVEGVVSIDQYTDHGSLEGYVVDTHLPQLQNYLESQGAAQLFIDKLLKKFNRLGLLRNLWVDEEYRNQKIATNLISNAIETAFQNNAEAIILVADTSEDNSQLGKSLEDWYKSWGFNTIGYASNDPIMILTK